MSEDESIESPAQVESPVKVPIAGIGTLVFGKWDASEVTCEAVSYTHLRAHET